MTAKGKRIFNWLVKRPKALGIAMAVLLLLTSYALFVFGVMDADEFETVTRAIQGFLTIFGLM